MGIGVRKWRAGAGQYTVVITLETRAATAPALMLGDDDLCAAPVEIGYDGIAVEGLVGDDLCRRIVAPRISAYRRTMGDTGMLKRLATMRRDR